MILLKRDCECKPLGFKSARQNMKFVNKQLTANQRQANLLSATSSSGKQGKVKVQEKCVFCVNCQNEYSFHYQLYCFIILLICS